MDKFNKQHQHKWYNLNEKIIGIAYPLSIIGTLQLGHIYIDQIDAKNNNTNIFSKIFRSRIKFSPLLFSCIVGPPIIGCGVFIINIGLVYNNRLINNEDDIEIDPIIDASWWY